MSPRLFLHVLSVSSRQQMSYRVDFWLHAVFAFAVELTIAYFLWQAIFSASGRETIGGYGFRGMLLYYVVVLLVGRLVRGRERDLSVAKEIYEGTLTRYLLYPASWAGFKYAEQLGTLLPGVVQVVALAGGLLVLAPAGYAEVAAEVAAGAGFTPLSVFLAFVAVLGGNLLWFLLRLPIQLVAFWADNVWSLNVLLRFAAEILGGMMLPLVLFPEVMRELLHWLPFRFLFSFPTLTLLGEISPGEWIGGMGILLAWCGVLALVSRAVWKRGELVYTGVGI